MYSSSTKTVYLLEKQRCYGPILSHLAKESLPTIFNGTDVEYEIHIHSFCYQNSVAVAKQAIFNMVYLSVYRV